MSRRLTHDVGASRHPLLMTDPIARDVLWWMADAAQERNDCRIIMTVADLAESMDRATAAVRKAQERLEKAGLIGEVGRGDYNKWVKVLCINEDALNQRNRVITHEASARNDSGIPATNLPQSCPDAALISPQPCPDAALMLPQSRPDAALYARARFEQEQEPEQDQKEISVGPIEPNAPPGPAPWSLTSHPEADRILAQHNAAASARMATLAAGRPAPVPKAEPLPLPIDPETAERTATEARVADALALLIPEFTAYYLETVGAKASARIEATWRKKLPTRLTDDGSSEAAVAARVHGIQTILRWWRLPHRDAVPMGVPSCWMDTHRRTLAFILEGTGKEPSANLDRLIGWANQPARPAPAQSKRAAAKPWADVGRAQLPPPTPDPVADAEHAERMAALDRIEREHLVELERQAIADARAAEAARLKPTPVAPLLPVKVPTETGRGGFARMSEALASVGR